jgi:hypothetical protein
MSKILSLVKALLPSMQSRQERDDTYIAEAVDIHDIERRMREVDGRSRNPLPGLQNGLGLR